MNRATRLESTAFAIRFREHVGQASVLERGQRVVVAVSGGLDSTALLHLVRFTLDDLRLDVRASHFDHAMRPSSQGDADWVAGLCRAWGVPLARGMATGKLQNEADARAARYHFLGDVRSEWGADWVLTAHHADDQAETVLFRAVRGSGLRGLSAIPATRDGWVARPLLPYSRRSIETYATGVGLSWRTDPTNADLGASRNVLRHVILPQLERNVAPGAARSLVELAQQAKDLDLMVAGLSEAALAALIIHEEPGRIVMDRTRMAAIIAPARAELLRMSAARLDVRLSRTGTRLATEVSRPDFNEGGRDLGCGLHISVQYEELVMETHPRAAVTRSLRVSSDTQGEGAVVVGGRSMRARWSQVQTPRNPKPDVVEAMFRTEALSFPLSIREWRKGDRIRLSYGSKKLTALFQEARLPRWRRTRQPLLVDSKDRVLWAPGLSRGVEAPPSDEHSTFWVALEDASAVEP